ncbi:MAG: LysR family transcriptional regulator [Pseudomonadota bacterium]|nr:LysR family transcriptional regulator [Pseudomonadota bacterium]
MLRENIQDLLAFVLVARERSFTKAAAQIGVSQSTLSHTIRALEERLGLRLLTRTTRSVSPTEAGERVLEGIAPLLTEIEAELAALIELRDQPGGLVRISSTDYATNTVLWPRLAPVMHQWPGLRIEIVTDYALGDIVAQRVDIGIRSGAQVARDMIAVRIAPDYRFAVVGAPAYLKAHPAPQTLAELPGHNCINLRTGTHDAVLPWTLMDGDKEIQLRVEGQWVFSNTYHKLDAALAGYGLAHLPEDLARPHVEAGHLRWVLPRHWPTHDGLHAYYPSRRQSSRALRVVIDALRWHPDEPR